jgi:hypothetical protein
VIRTESRVEAPDENPIPVLRLVFRRSWAAVAILQFPFALLELIVSDLAPRIARLESIQGTLYLTMAGSRR